MTHPPDPPEPTVEQQPPTQPAGVDTAKPEPRSRWSDPLSLVLVLVIVAALVLAGAMFAEIMARRIADGKVAGAAKCVAEDDADVSFGALPPFLWQHINGRYDNITIKTAGNQLRSAKGMRAEVVIDDVDLHGDANSKGTIGALDATITWSSDGIQQTIQDSIPVVGMFLDDVTTNSSDGTVKLHGTFGDITAKPEVKNNKLSLQVVDLSVMSILGGFSLPSESVQPTLDSFTNTLVNDLPLGIHPDSVQVTDNGVVAHFSTRNAKIPTETENRCFEKL